MGRNLTRAGRVIRFIETHCFVPEGNLQGKPFRLLDFQKRFIREVYDNPNTTRHAYLSIARRNGKTGLIACLLICHLVGPEAIKNTQIVSGARSRDQASLVFGLARKIIEANPDLSSKIRVIPSKKMLIGKWRGINTEYTALAAEGTSNLGRSPVLAILDEVGAIDAPTDEFVDSITTAQGSHERPLLIAISTQAANSEAMFSQWLDDAAEYNDPHTVSHVYSAPKDCKLSDIEAIRAANPALGVFRSIQDAKSQAEKAERMPADANKFRNLILNQRVDRETPFVSRDLWQANGADPLALDPDLPIFAGLDLSKTTDLTALILAQWKNGWNIHTHCFIPGENLNDRSKADRVPYNIWVDQGQLIEVPGPTVDYDYVAGYIAEQFASFTFERVAFDPWRIADFQKSLERVGFDLPLVPVHQSYRGISPCIERLESALLKGDIRHGNQPVLTSAAFGVAVKTDGINRAFEKKKSRKRIDPLQAMAMCFSQEHEPQEKKKKAKVNIDEWINDPLRLF